MQPSSYSPNTEDEEDVYGGEGGSQLDDNEAMGQDRSDDAQAMGRTLDDIDNLPTTDSPDALEDAYNQPSYDGPRSGGGDAASANTPPPGGASSDAAATSRLARGKAAAGKAKGIADQLEFAGKDDDFGETKRKISGNRAVLTGAGLGTGLVGLLIAAAVTLLPLKLEHMLKNIEEAQFDRIETVYAFYDDAFMKDYIKVRLETGGNPVAEDRYFRSKGISPTHPFRNAYDFLAHRSAFEEDMAKKTGFRFINDSRTGNVVRVRDHGKDFTYTEADIDKIYNTGPGGSLDTGAHKAARAAIGGDVKVVTNRWQLVKRHQIRGWMRRSTGVKRFRFFEKTNDNASRFVRSQYSKFVLDPAYSHFGAWIDCVFTSVDRCPKTDSLNDPANQASTDTDSSGEAKKIQEAAQEAAQEIEDPASDLSGSEERVAAKPAGTAEQKLFKPVTIFESLLGEKLGAKLAPGINLVSWAVMLDTADQALTKNVAGTIRKSANAMQYTGAFTALAVLTDQMKTGEDVDIKQVNAAMNKFSNIDESPAYQQDVNGKTPAPNAIPADEKVSGDGGGSLSQTYKDTIGKPIHIALAPVHATLGLYGIRQALELLNTIVGAVFNQLFDLVKTFTPSGVGNTATAAAGWIGTKISGFAMPKFTGTETDGKAYTMASAGGEVTAARFGQSIGGHALSPAETAEIDAESEEMKSLDSARQSSWTRVASLDDNDSVASRLLMATPMSTGEVRTATARMIAAIPNPFSLLRSQTGQLALDIFTPGARARAGDVSLIGQTPYGATRGELKDPIDLNEEDCKTEIAAFDAALASGDDSKADNAFSQCKMFESYADSMTCSMNDDAACGGLSDDGGEADACPAGGCGSGGGINTISGTRDELNQQLLENPKYTSTHEAADKADIESGAVSDDLVKVMIAIMDQGGFDLKVTALKSSHTTVDGENGHNPGGVAVDIGYNATDPTGQKLYKWLYQNYTSLKIRQLIFDPPPDGLQCIGQNGANDASGPVDCASFYEGAYAEHTDHIHVGVFK